MTAASQARAAEIKRLTDSITTMPANFTPALRPKSVAAHTADALIERLRANPDQWLRIDRPDDTTLKTLGDCLRLRGKKVWTDGRRIRVFSGDTHVWVGLQAGGPS